MKSLMVIFGIALSLWGADASESQSGPLSPAATPSDVVQDTDSGQECLDQAEQDEMLEPSPAGKTCAEMGWYEADEGALCKEECGKDCVKKQWCGTGWCQPWPHYCWKCS